MSGSVSFNPAMTNTIASSFAADSRGFVQGAMQDDPSVRQLLKGGPLASTETVPMWAGVAIGTYLPPVGQGHLGSVVKRAVLNSGITGFSVANMQGNAIMLPGGTVPLLYSGQKISFFDFGSNARIPLQIDPALVNQDGSITTTAFSWDFTEQRLTLASPAYAQQTPSAYTSYVSSTGVLSLTFATAPAVVVGQYVEFAGFTGSQVGLNTTMPVLTTASGGTVLTFQAPVGLGSFTPANGYLVAGGGTLGIRKVEFITGSGNKVINYNTATGAITWVESGAIAMCVL